MNGFDVDKEVQRWIVGMHRETLTPDLAAELLLNNSTNRPLRSARLKAMRRDHLAGELDGRAVHIVVDWDGNLINGQHTCTTVVDTGLPLPHVLIERGVDPAIGRKIDRGIPKSTADALASLGAANRSQLAAVLKVVLLMRDSSHIFWSSSCYPTEAQMVARYEEDRALFDEATRIGKVARDATRINLTCYAALAAIVGLRSSEWLSWDLGFRTGIDLAAGDPRLTARNWALKPILSNSGNYAAQYRMVCLTRAWNAWVRDEGLTILKWPGKALPMPAPLVMRSGDEAAS